MPDGGANVPEPARIAFAKKDGSPSDTFKAGSKVWWEATLDGAGRDDIVSINVYNATGDLLHTWVETVGRGRISSRRATLTDAPGTYLMQYLKDDVVIAEGTYTLTNDEPPDVGSGSEDCDPSYPDFCIPSAPPDLDCGDVAPHQSFTVVGVDPHHFDADGDGDGCEPPPAATVKPNPTPKPDKTRKPANNGNCDPSYPTLCLPSSPDLDCGDINARRFPVSGRDPHGFDGDHDGIGCESD